MALSAEEMLERARKLPIPTPWDLNEFIANIAEMRRRPIHLIGTDTVTAAGSPCGLWLVRPHDDVILYDQNTSTYHIDQIVRHEVGHMVLGHDLTLTDQTVPEATSDVFRNVLPDIRADTIRAVLGRTDFANEQEREAETFASLIMLAGREKEKRAPRPMMRSVFFPNDR
ncbi:hypothetical protein [Mycobacteroides salmoniphilum]|uniref:hypothetical protein n=1 Tax=Mycobacteroides salmoniphilum TaxID=404941 RepID=UPI0010666D59|nr:hypothetical protein [Mycobacteroides salmoniphilum]TDZ91444.1 hypothetical protein CCUG62472_04705 [Mycobacteroides salmoniphilum]